MVKTRRIFACAGLCLGALALFAGMAGPAIAQDRIERITFAPGGSSQSNSGSIAGKQTVQYRLALLAGQRLNVKLATNNKSTVFSVGEAGTPVVFTSATKGGDSYGMKIPSSGDYEVNVFMASDAAARNEHANFTLTVQVTGGTVVKPGAALPPDFADGLSGGPDFWTVGNVPAGDRLNVRTKPAGKAKILVRLPNGAKLRNHGCKMNGPTRWCKIETDAGVTGWAAGRFLHE